MPRVGGQATILSSRSQKKNFFSNFILLSNLVQRSKTRCSKLFLSLGNTLVFPRKIENSLIFWKILDPLAYPHTALAVRGRAPTVSKNQPKNKYCRTLSSNKFVL